MTDTYFNSLLEGIYSIFGRQRPNFGSAAYSSLRKRVEERYVPNEAVPFIISRFEDYDSLPMNLGKAIMREFGEWLSQNPQKRAYVQAGCNNCGKDSGWYYATDGRYTYACKCACNEDERFTRIAPITMQGLVERGWQRLDELEKEKLEFSREQIRLWREGKPYQKPWGVSGVIGAEFEPREEHKQALYDMEF